MFLKNRISAKRILLTYSQVGSGLSTNHVLKQLQCKLGRFHYVISQEKPNDGGTHFHLLLIHRNKFNIKNVLDLQINGHVVYYKPVYNLNSSVYYVCKEKQYITNLENLQEKQLLTLKDFIYQQVRLKGVDKALLEYSQTHKEKYSFC